MPSKTWSRASIIQAYREFGHTYGEGPRAKHMTNKGIREYHGLPSTGTVTKYFGSHNSALEAAGFPRRPRGVPGHELPIPRCANGRFLGFKKSPDACS